MQATLVALLTLFVYSNADRQRLPLLGATRKIVSPELRDLPNFFPSNSKNVRIQAATGTRLSPSPFLSLTARNLPTASKHPPIFSKNFPVASRSLPTASINLPTDNSVEFSSNSESTTETDSTVTTTQSTSELFDSVTLFDQTLHDSEPHIGPFPLIPFNQSVTSTERPYQSFLNSYNNNDKDNNYFNPTTSLPQPLNLQGNIDNQFKRPQQFGGYFTNQPVQNFPQENTNVGFNVQPTDRPQNDYYTYQPLVPVFTQPINTRFPEEQVPIDYFNQPNRQPIDFPTPVDQSHIEQRPYVDISQQPIDNIPTVIPLGGKSLEQIIEQEWSEFTTRFNKVYATSEEARYRREIFIENRAKIQRFNTEYADGKRKFVQRINPFADMLNHEFNTQFCGFNRSRHMPRNPIKPASAFVPSANVVFPESVDWREVGAVGPVKSQGKCAGCWAFAAAGALEGHHFRKTGKLVDVSVQNLLDCTESYGNSGCSGGLMNPAFEYVRDNNGVDSDQSYPYEQKAGECRFKKDDVVATCTGFVDIDKNDEKGLEIALGTLGPVTAAIDASKETFQFYSEGIYDDPTCGNTPDDMNHAVLIVGYGTDPDGRKYWLVKNSYGSQWGIGGYIKIAKENGSQCGIAIQASYPLV